MRTTFVFILTLRIMRGTRKWTRVNGIKLFKRCTARGVARRGGGSAPHDFEEKI